MNDHARLVRLSRHFAAAGRRDEVAGLLKAVAEAMRSAPDCFGAQVASSDRDSEQLVLISRWESQEAMEHYLGSEEFGGFQRELASSLEGPPDAENFTTA